MTGPDLRTLLAEWNISRRMFADSLALVGYRVEAEHVTRWGERVPATAERLIEDWQANPEKRPAYMKREPVYPVRKRA